MLWQQVVQFFQDSASEAVCTAIQFKDSATGAAVFGCRMQRDGGGFLFWLFVFSMVLLLLRFVVVALLFCLSLLFVVVVVVDVLV